MIVFKDERSGSYVFGRLLGAVSKDDVRVQGHNRQCLFREAYHPHATICEIIEQEAFVEEVRPPKKDADGTWIERTAYFLKPEAGVPVAGEDDAEAAKRLVEPDARLRHSHDARFVDYWAQCSHCQKWRIVPFSTYVEARKAMSEFHCANGDCDAPQTEEEEAGLAQAREFN